MSALAFVLILASVVLHAGWHFISKSQRPPLAFFLLISFGGFCSTLPFTLASGIDLSALPGKFWLMVSFGAFCGVVCNTGLSFAYRLADVSLAYPLARALPVLLTAFVTECIYFSTGYGAPLGIAGIIGMIVIFAGCIIMPLNDFSSFRLSSYTRNRALPWILIAALGTTGYTVFDKAGIDLMLKYGKASSVLTGSCAYSSIREMILFFFLFVIVLTLPHERENLKFSMFGKWQGYVSGLFAAAAYVLVLLAMHWVTNVSYVQAFRQMSLPVGVFLGIVFLKEKTTAPKLAGLALIVTGLVLAAFK